MNENFKFKKRPGSETDDLVIRAIVCDANGTAFHPLTFMRERVDYITEISQGMSGIALKNGAKIAVAMPYEELEQKIYFADIIGDPVLDLRAVTEEKAASATVPTLLEVFASAASASKEIVDKPLTIAVFARQEGELNFQMFSFKDTDVEWSEVDGAGNGRNGAYTTLPLSRLSGPFGESEIIIDMARTIFMEQYSKAKMDGANMLDLRDQTRQRTPGGPKFG